MVKNGGRAALSALRSQDAPIYTIQSRINEVRDGQNQDIDRGPPPALGEGKDTPRLPYETDPGSDGAVAGRPGRGAAHRRSQPVRPPSRACAAGSGGTPWPVRPASGPRTPARSCRAARERGGPGGS